MSFCCTFIIMNCGEGADGLFSVTVTALPLLLLNKFQRYASRSAAQESNKAFLYKFGESQSRELLSSPKNYILNYTDVGLWLLYRIAVIRFWSWASPHGIKTSGFDFSKLDRRRWIINPGAQSRRRCIEPETRRFLSPFIQIPNDSQVHSVVLAAPLNDNIKAKFSPEFL